MFFYKTHSLLLYYLIFPRSDRIKKYFKSVIVFSIGVPGWIKEGNKGGLARLIPNAIKIFMNSHRYTFWYVYYYIFMRLLKRFKLTQDGSNQSRWHTMVKTSNTQDMHRTTTLWPWAIWIKVWKPNQWPLILWWSLAWFSYFHSDCPWPYCDIRPHTDFDPIVPNRKGTFDVADCVLAALMQ